jgi:hypothetical protein
MTAVGFLRCGYAELLGIGVLEPFRLKAGLELFV